MPAKSEAVLRGIGVSTPAFRCAQSQASDFAERGLRERAAHAGHTAAEIDTRAAFLRRIYRRSGIKQRASVCGDFIATDASAFSLFPAEGGWSLLPSPSTATRMRAYEVESLPLAEEACRRALAAAQVAPAAVTHLIVASCTGFTAPGLDVLLPRALGLPAGCHRQILGFMGCHAGLSALRTASQLIAGNPEAVVLQVNVELCSLHFQADDAPDTIVANALFADGAAAAIWSSSSGTSPGAPHAQHPAEPGCPAAPAWRVRAARCAIAPESLDRMSWRIGDTGFIMRLDPAVPDLLQRHAPELIDGLLAECGLSLADVRGWAVHPGGTRILSALTNAFSPYMSEDSLAASYGVLRDHGNMSSATVLFVLQRELARLAEAAALDPTAAGPVAAMAFGPGLTVEMAILEPVALPG